MTQPKNQLSLQEEDADRQGFAGKALLIIAWAGKRTFGTLGGAYDGPHATKVQHTYSWLIYIKFEPFLTTWKQAVQSNTSGCFLRKGIQ